jgi:hypothetical protein
MDRPTEEPKETAMENPQKQKKDVVIGPDPDRTNKGSKSYTAEGGPVQGKKRDDPPTGGGDQNTKSPQSYPVEGD